MVVLLSGGIDSSVAAGYLKSKDYDIYPLFINHHQGPLDAERQAASYIASSLGLPKPVEVEVDLKFLKAVDFDWQTFGIGTPARNMVFISLATMYAGVIDADAIALASAYGSTFADTSYAFLQLIEQVSKTVLDRKIQVFSPFKAEKWTSSEIVRQGSKYGVHLDKTWSCFLPRDVQCGICIKCKDRKKRFQKANVKDKTLYSSEGVTQKQLDKAITYV